MGCCTQTNFRQYEPKYWWFECFIITHKMLMTGALVIIAKGSTVQPLVAVLFQLIFLLTVLKLAPVRTLLLIIAYFFPWSLT